MWGDPWIPDIPSFLPSPRESTDTSQVLAGNQLMTIGKNAWNVDKLKELFDEATVVTKKIKITHWSHSLKTINENFCVRSAYKELNH